MALAGSSLRKQRPVVGRHLVQQRLHVLTRHRLDEVPLAREWQVLEHLGRLAAGQSLERQHLFVEVQAQKGIGQILRAGGFGQVVQAGIRVRVERVVERRGKLRGERTDDRI